MKNKPYYLIRQRGVVLFLALIALVVMSLAAVALIRSVDTNTVITGNLAFKQSAVVASDAGAEAAFAWLDTNSLNPTTFENNATGYYATIPDLHQAPPYVGQVNLDDAAEIRTDAAWADSVTIPSLGDANEINYIVQRMCLNAGPPDDDCLYGSRPLAPDLNSDCGYQTCAEIGSEPSPIYRVTVRVRGPKNTVSFTQAYAY